MKKKLNQRIINIHGWWHNNGGFQTEQRKKPKTTTTSNKRHIHTHNNWRKTTHEKNIEKFSEAKK